MPNKDTTPHHFLSRRGLLSRTGLLASPALATLLAPVLRQRDAHGAAKSPRRIILIFSPNGPMTACGPAHGTETDFTFHDWWKPLERHKADGIFLSHMAATGSGVVAGDGHALGAQIFAGYGGGLGGDQYMGRGETIDQLVGKRLEFEYRAGLVRTLVWGASGSNGNNLFYAGPGRQISPETNPSRAWAQLYASFMSPKPGEADVARAGTLLARDRSVLDFVSQDCVALKSALGREGTRLLDDHCTNLRAQERNLVAGLSANPVAASCDKPADPGTRDWANPENIEDQMAAFRELIATSLACEMSHVIGFQIAGRAARFRLPAAYGVPSSPKADSGDSGPAHHPWTHQGQSEEKIEAMRLFTTFYSVQVALLVDKLKSTVDAHGQPLLDSTVVLWASELGGNEKNPGGSHQTGSLPVVMFGRGQGVFKTGRYIRGKSKDVEGNIASIEPGRDMARLLVSLVRYMGLPDVKTVGATGVDGPLACLYG